MMQPNVHFQPNSVAGIERNHAVVASLAVQRRAEARLQNQAYHALRNVSCHFQNGVLILRGSLPSYYLKQVAQEVVADVEDVRRVDNQIQVSTAT